MKRIREEIRNWHIHRRTPSTIAELAKQYNPAIQGWWNYYGTFYPTAMRKLSRYIDEKLEQWARRKYKTLLRHQKRSEEWLRKRKSENPQMFVHWSITGRTVG
jgi:RNA-directed DNA polymerase